ncbi:MAG: ATP-dependent DNA helicase RecG [Flavobacteriales bacterium]|nr:ATP-dependent DNA helicase RecG [Flavobacteriales bacterium]
MRNNILDTPIEYLKGVGPSRAKLLNEELSIYTFNDLLTHFPFRYIDRSKFYTISQINTDSITTQLKGVISHIEEIGKPRQKRLVAHFEDDTGIIQLVWFKGIKWIKPTLKKGSEYIVYGKPTKYGSGYNIAHPELELVEDSDIKNKNFQPVYHSTEKLNSKGLNSRGIAKLTYNLIKQLNGHIAEVLPKKILEELRLVSLAKAYEQIHIPSNQQNQKRAEIRLKFDEFFFLQLRMIKQKLLKEQKTKGFVFEKVGVQFNTFYKKHLSFDLTNAQKSVIKEIRRDIGSGKHMNRLLQGDVGSGKTIVALLIMLIALDNNFQACLMAPTEILANQHFFSVAEALKDLPINVRLLTGSTKQAERKEIHKDLLTGKIHILIGTHALLEDIVQFKNLGLAIIDEQHKFGVVQRAKLWKKNSIPPHVLVMTATPIPRTLAMTFYGDLDISVIDELPPGRKPIKTIHYFDNTRLKVFEFMRKQIDLGKQIYVVYPLIEESEKLDYKDLMDGYESISRSFPAPKYRVSVVHGKMKPTDKDYEMEQFASGKTQIMVATTVIEVGVNIPNASVMVIESSEKFGLSQLHQLRGRVGRGADQSYCILMSSYKLSKEAKVRLDTMVNTNDGFEVAEVDLKLRGPGDLMGTQQSGVLDFKIADLAKDNSILTKARSIAIKLLKADPNLEMTENVPVKNQLIKLFKNKLNWSRIS